jgi:hypothetical protein
MKEAISKIIYFDKETIRNILQEQNKGSRVKRKDYVTSVDASAEISSEAKINLGIPFLERLSFLFSGKIKASAMMKRESATTITSTEISEFKSLKSNLIRIDNVLVEDIENSSTFFRVAGSYLRISSGEVEGVDIKEFKAVMDGFDGYDTYKVNSDEYVRYNNTAFVSNYKRNDLLSTKMTIYCIKVGEFPKEKFDFFKQLKRMESLLTNVSSQSTLSDIYLDKENIEIKDSQSSEDILIKLYDVVYACIEKKVKN